MSLNFKYMLYFEKPHLWDALLGLTRMAEQVKPPSVIHFPDHDLNIPFVSCGYEPAEFYHTAEQFCFATSLFFEMDQEIMDFISYSGLSDDDRSPPPDQKKDKVAIGYIDLVIHQTNPFTSTPGLVLFQFFTTGTHMSLLFENSISIQKAFSKLLEDYYGVCGILELELSGGELFWYRGRRIIRHLPNAYISPLDIEI